MTLNTLLKIMLQKNASDLYITANSQPCMRIKGKILPVTKKKLSSKDTKSVVMSLLTDEQKEKLNNGLECDFFTSCSGIGLFRVSVFIEKGQLGVVYHTIQTLIPTQSDLKLPEIINDLTMIKKGLVILAGTTNSGKSSSLAAMINYRNHHSTGHIATIEDHIKFMHEPDGCVLTQKEVGIDTGSFNNGVKNSVKQCPDVIVIDEINTYEIMEQAISFSKKGGLCLVTLNCSIQALSSSTLLEWLIDIFPENKKNWLISELSQNLNAILVQKLIPTLEGENKRAAVEIMLNTPLMRDAIKNREFDRIRDIIGCASEDGMKTLEQSLFELYQEGVINYDTALKYSTDVTDLHLKIKLSSNTEDNKYNDSTLH